MPEDVLSVLRGEEAQRIFRDHRLTAAYLFGSHVQGCADSRSDIDIAVLFGPGGDAGRRFDETTSIQLELKPLLGTPLDIVSLNDANALVAFEAVCRGKEVSSSGGDEQILYELRLRHRYEEFRHIQDIFTQALRDKLE